MRSEGSLACYATVTQGILGTLRGPLTYTYTSVADRLTVELTQPGLTCFQDLGLSRLGSVGLAFEHSTCKEIVFNDYVTDTAPTGITYGLDRGVHHIGNILSF